MQASIQSESQVERLPGRPINAEQIIAWCEKKNGVKLYRIGDDIFADHDNHRCKDLQKFLDAASTIVKFHKQELLKVVEEYEPKQSIQPNEADQKVYEDWVNENKHKQDVFIRNGERYHVASECG